MVHEAIDFFSLFVAIVALIAVWKGPEQPENRRTFLRYSFLSLVLTFGAFWGWEKYNEVRKEQREQAELENKERQTLALLCDRDMNYEDIYNTINMGWSDEVLNAALDDLLQARQEITVNPISLPSPVLPNKQIQVRFYHLRDRSRCSSTSK